MDSDNSSVEIHIPRRGKACRHRILSSDEESPVKKDEVQSSPACSTPCGCATGTPSQSFPDTSQHSIETSAGLDEVLITCSGGTDSPWESDQDSDSSTPDFKRGRHEGARWSENGAGSPVKQEPQRMVIMPSIPRWMKRKRGPTTVILSDQFLQEWPSNQDRCCKVFCRSTYDMWKWNSVIRSQHVEIASFYNVVFCFNKFKDITGAVPLSNHIQALGRSVHSVNPGCHIFICNLPPNPQGSPVLGRRLSAVNFDIQTTVAAARRKVTKLHLLSIFEHFVSSEGRIITPVQMYFKSELTLTVLGCALFREFVLREIGAKSYWFTEERSESME